MFETARPHIYIIYNSCSILVRRLQVSCSLLLQAGLSNLRGSASDPGRRWFQRGQVFSGPEDSVGLWPAGFCVVSIVS